MQDPWDDLNQFNWVLALGSTLAAAKALGLPQSSISRRFRQFCTNHRLSVKRQDGSYHLIGQPNYLQSLRAVAQQFRMRNNRCCWGFWPSAFSLTQLPADLPGVPVALPADFTMGLGQAFEERILDLLVLPEHQDPLDGLPLLASPLQPGSDIELEGLLAFRRQLHRQLLTLRQPPHDQPLASLAAIPGLSERRGGISA
ncbi:MAG: LysR family transcriptional regulator [Cyanobacteriota bacterium]|nr:LysR family transcriptional regulator [Cyanobacteriota bacterium]